MRMLVLVAPLAVGTLIAAEGAYAQQNPTAPKTGYAQRHRPPNVEAGRITRQSNDVRSGDRVIGHDPDPFIRGEILRQHSLGFK